MKALLISVFSLVSFTAASEQCPVSLQGVAVHEQAKLCHQFSPTEHSKSQSLSYFVPLTPTEMLAYYQQQHNQLTLHSTFNQRAVLTMQDDAIRVIVSEDANGSQIDILVL